MLKKTRLGTLPGTRALRAGAAAALIAASIAIGAGPVAAGSLSQGSRAAWALLILQKQASAHSQMSEAGVGPSLAGNSGG